MLDRRLGAFKDRGTVPVGGNPPSPLQLVRPARRPYRLLAESAYRYRRPTEQVAEMRRVEFNQHIRQGLQTKTRNPSTAVQSLSGERKKRKSGPVRFVETLLVTWRLQPPDAVPLLGFGPSEEAHVRDILNGRSPLVGHDIKDRIAFLLVIRSTLSEMFRDEGVENEWLREAHPALDGLIPMALLLDGHMENLLIVKDYVDEFAGR